MLWIVLTTILSIAFVVSVLVSVGSSKDNPDGKFGGAVVAVICVVAFLILTGATSLARLQTGQIGLVYNFAGKLVGVKDNPGVIWKAPWTRIEKTSVQIQREEFVLDEGNSAVSKDQQPIFADLVLNYRLDPNAVLDLYRKVGPTWKAKLIDSRVLQDFKEITATYPTIAMTANREGLRQETKKRLEAELSKYSITVTDFFISNLSFSKEYTAAIEQKQVQVQAAARAFAKVQQVKAEAEQKVEKAQGEAEAIRLKGAALRNNPEILQLEAIDKLAPNASVIICTGQTCPAFLPQAAGSTGKK